ncbi:hypothetical protein ABZZ79_34125 [Streptomyces sp. NPDC006458]
MEAVVETADGWAGLTARQRRARLVARVITAVGGKSMDDVVTLLDN